MPYQYEGVCYPDSLSTLSVIAARLSGGIVNVSGTPYVLDVTPAAGGLNYAGTRLDIPGGIVYTKYVPVTLQNCQLLSASDGLTMSWLVVAVWAVVFAVLMMRRGV